MHPTSRAAAAILCLSGVACGAPPSGSEDSAGEEPVVCEATLEYSSPEPGATDVDPVTAHITASLRGAEWFPYLWVDGVSGYDYELSDDDEGGETVLDFYPSAPLAPGTTYEAIVHPGITDLVGSGVECEPIRWPFTTGALQPTDAQALQGRTYRVDLQNGADGMTWTTPRYTDDSSQSNPGWSYLQQWLGADATSLLLQVRSADTESLQLEIARGEQYALDDQYACDETVLLEPTAFGGNPHFEPTKPAVLGIGTNVADELLEYHWTRIPLYGAQISGTFAPDGNAIHFVKISGLYDIRPTARNTWCNSSGGPCEACPDGERSCIYVEMVGGTAREIYGDVQSRTLEQACDRSACESAPECN